jgi:hypothetical protein
VSTGMVLANFEWNVFIRGILFPAIMFIILCGSSYMIMATNMGNRLGFMVALTGLIGWLFLMSIVWMLYGIGLKGKEPSWKVTDVITGSPNLGVAKNKNVAKLKQMEFASAWCRSDADVQNDAEYKKALKMKEGIAQTRAMKKAEDAVEAKFAKVRDGVKAKSGWMPLCVGTGQRGDGQSTVDATLVTKKSDPTKTPRAIFKESTEYASIAAYKQGGDNDLFTIGTHPVHLRHSPHWFVIQVQPYKTREIKEPVLGQGRVQLKNDKGELQFTTKTEIIKEVDTSKPITSVVMLRDQGSKRKPPFTLFIFSGLAFAILASILHQRDKQVMSLMGKLPKGKPTTA